MQSFGIGPLVGVEIGGSRMGFFTRHWGMLLSVFPFLGPFWRVCKLLLQWAGDFDLIISRIEDPDWMGVVVKSIYSFFLDPPGYLILPFAVSGFALIWFDSRRQPKAVPISPAARPRPGTKADLQLRLRALRTHQSRQGAASPRFII
jgi:hypothetical protein